MVYLAKHCCFAGDKESEIGVAASTSLLIGLLVSISEVCDCQTPPWMHAVLYCFLLRICCSAEAPLTHSLPWAACKRHKGQ